MKTFLTILFLSLQTYATDPSTSFDISYEGRGTIHYRDCGQCVGYYSAVQNSASIVLYDKDNFAYWTINIQKNENENVHVEIYFVERNPSLPQNLRGYYYPVYDVSQYFEYKDLNLEKGGLITAKIHPVKLKSLHSDQIATFSGSFSIQIH